MAMEALLTPQALHDGETLNIHIDGAEALAGENASVVLARTDTIETGWVASVGVEIEAGGTAEVQWANVSLGRESAVFAVAIELHGQRHAIESSQVSVVNPTTPVATPDDAAERRATLACEQEAGTPAG